MTAFGLAWRTVQRYRARTALAIVGVAVIGALLFDMLLLSRGLLLSFADLLDRGGYDVRVASPAGLAARAPIEGSKALAAAIHGLPQVDRVASIRLAPIVIRRGGKGVHETTLVGTDDASPRVWTVIRGENLDSPAAARERCPLVISRTLAAWNHFEPGASLEVVPLPGGGRSALPPVECRVSAIADFAFAGSSDATIATTLDGIAAVSLDRDSGANLILIASKSDGSPEATAKAVQALRPDLRVFSNDDVVAQINQNGFAYFRQISYVLSSVTMVFAFLLVATLLTVSINGRLGEIAALRALGIGRPRIAAMLLWESTLLVGTGAVLAVPLGELLAQILDRILKQMPGVPEQLHFFVFEPRAVVIHAAVLAFTAVAAAAYPVWLTARLPIASTLRQEVLG